jgi:hypothetical protein
VSIHVGPKPRSEPLFDFVCIAFVLVVGTFLLVEWLRHQANLWAIGLAVCLAASLLTITVLNFRKRWRFETHSRLITVSHGEGISVRSELDADPRIRWSRQQVAGLRVRSPPAIPKSMQVDILELKLSSSSWLELLCGPPDAVQEAAKMVADILKLPHNQLT